MSTTTAKITKMDWKKNTWIGSPTRGGHRTPSPAIYYRREFSLTPKKGQEVWLRIACLGIFECEINGKKVGKDCLAPGWTDYAKRVFYFNYEVSKLLKPGKNVIGVTLGNGWFCGHVGNLDRQHYGEHPYFSALIESAGRKVLTTDTKWKYCDNGPIVENDLYMGESYDARKEFGAWSSAGFSDKAWLPALKMSTPKTSVELSPSTPICEHEKLPATVMGSGSNNAWEDQVLRYDLGQNIAGKYKIRLRGPKGMCVTLRFAEMLESDGSLHTANLRTARATDFYTIGSEGKWEEYSPKFTFHGFRYVEVRYHSSWRDAKTKLEVASIEGIVLHTDMKRTGEFDCSNPALNKLMQNIRWGQKGNFLDVPTDCPQRDERLGWTGDAQAFARTATFFFDVEGFFHKWMQDLRDSAGPLGEMPSFSPSIACFGCSSHGNSGWADAIFICTWSIYLAYGDKSILAENFDAMVKYLDFLDKKCVKDDIRSHPDIDQWGGFGDWLAVDTKGVFVDTDKCLIGVAFHAIGAEITAKSAELLGKDAKPFWDLRGRIQAAFEKRFLATNGSLTVKTQTAHVLALASGLVPAKFVKRISSDLVSLIAKNNGHMGTGFLGTPHILPMLEQTGHLDLAYKLLEADTFPSWLFPVKNGATTIWERWDSWTPEKGFHSTGMNSFNHYAYGAVGAWIISTVVGIELDEKAPGYKHIIFKPRPGGSLTHASASLETRFGRTAIAWKKDKSGKLEISLEIPKGASATLDLLGQTPRSLAPGKHTIKV